MAEPPVTFAGVLRRRRTEARLTEEELAEATGLSPWSISDLERGIATTPQRETIRLQALGVLAARSLVGRHTPKGFMNAPWRPPGR